MPNVRNTVLKKYGISSYRFMELYYYCLQYNEWKQWLKNNCDTVRSARIDGLPVTGSHVDATQKLAVSRAELSHKCEIIEQTAIETDPEIHPYILKAVTNEGITYNYLSTAMNIPCGRDMYYDRRRKFYWLLSQKV